MGEVIVITSGKGGVGKTTTTANIGTALAMMGKRTVLLDTDIGLRNLDVVMGLENRIVYHLVDVTENRCRLHQAMIRYKKLDTLSLIPAAQTRDKSAVSEGQMKKVTDALKKEFDYVLIDCPAGIEQGFKNAVAGADRALVVTTPEISAVRDADRVIGLLEAAGLPQPQVIVNRVRFDMVRRGEMMNIEDILDILAVDLIGIVADDEDIVISTNRGEPIAKNQLSAAGKSFRNIARRIAGEDVPFFHDGNGRGFWRRVRAVFAR